MQCLLRMYRGWTSARSPILMIPGIREWGVPEQAPEESATKERCLTEHLVTLGFSGICANDDESDPQQSLA